MPEYAAAACRIAELLGGACALPESSAAESDQRARRGRGLVLHVRIQ
jgi:hypothetical protein